jgi:muramoyltetrapeptide carboxypeptidase LdcA involved in peptidoglycan recycling
VTKPSGTEYEGMKIMDHRRAPGTIARLASSGSQTLDFAAPSSTISALKTLAKNVAAHLAERAFCVIFEDDLERCWPSNRIKRADREKEIHSFAKSQGWSAVILTADSGTRAMFRAI